MRRCVRTPTRSTARVRNRRKHRNVAAGARNSPCRGVRYRFPNTATVRRGYNDLRFRVRRSSRNALSGESLLKNRRFAKRPYNDITAYGAMRSVSVSV
jgi:hypothetical protein